MPLGLRVLIVVFVTNNFKIGMKLQTIGDKRTKHTSLVGTYRIAAMEIHVSLTTIQSQKETFRFFQCGMKFSSLNDMMQHRKNSHQNIEMCKQFLNKTCQRNNECWWSHEVLSDMENQSVGFQKAPANLAPPLSVWTNPNPPQSNVNPIMIQIMTKLEEDMNMVKKMLNLNIQV